MVDQLHAELNIASDLRTVTDDEGDVLRGVEAMLRLAGEDHNRHGLTDTPMRVLKAWRELTARPGDPETLLGTVFTDADYPPDEMIAVGPIPFTSVCEHHLLPFTGHAWVAYVPGPKGIVGLSKIPRLVEHYARRPQVQERLTTQIADALIEHLDPLGSAVKLAGVHSCMTLRGVQKEAVMTTCVLRKLFKHDPSARAEFLALTR